MKILWAVLYLLMCGGCTAFSRSHIYKANEDVAFDSTYIYGYAIVGEQSELWIDLRQPETGALTAYTKRWADNGVYKEHIFAFNLPPGIWELESIRTGGGPHGGFTHEVKMAFEAREDSGNFLGKFETRTSPSPGLKADDDRLRADKREIDAYMAGRYGRFDVRRTYVAPRTRSPAEHPQYR